MIVDIILDRQDGQPYEPKEFYTKVMNHYEIMPEIAGPIAEAMDSGEEADVKRELVRYLRDGNYNDSIARYVLSVNWL